MPPCQGQQLPAEPQGRGRSRGHPLMGAVAPLPQPGGEQEPFTGAAMGEKQLSRDVVAFPCDLATPLAPGTNAQSEGPQRCMPGSGHPDLGAVHVRVPTPRAGAASRTPAPGWGCHLPFCWSWFPAAPRGPLSVSAGTAPSRVCKGLCKRACTRGAEPCRIMLLMPSGAETEIPHAGSQTRLFYPINLPPQLQGPALWGFLGGWCQGTCTLKGTHVPEPPHGHRGGKTGSPEGHKDPC